MYNYFFKKRNLSILSILLIVTMLFSSIPLNRVFADSSSAPDNTSVVMNFTLNKTTYTVNGVPTLMDTSPITRNERTLLPVVYVAGPLGADINWNAATKKVTISLNDTLMELWIGKSVAKINGTDTLIDPSNSNVKPITISGRTMLPLRFVAESLGCEVGWNEATQGIAVTYSKTEESKTTDIQKKIDTLKEEISKKEKEKDNAADKDKLQKEIDDLKTELEQLEKELNGELKIPDGIFKSDNIIKPNNAHKGIYEKINDKTTPDDKKKHHRLNRKN